jgi:hypothetical protein
MKEIKKYKKERKKLQSYDNQISGNIQGRRSHRGSGPRCPNNAGAVRGQLVAPFCDNKRIKALTNKLLLLTCLHMYKYIL